MSNIHSLTGIDNKIECLLKEKSVVLLYNACISATMSTICIKVSEKESAAIEAYAIMCGESVSELIRKVVIQEVTFMKNRSSVQDPKIYDYHMLVPVNISNDDENQIIEANYNKIREILGWKKISLGGY